MHEVAPATQHEFAATVISPNDSQLASEVGAVIRTIHADVGASVAAGDLLIELDRRDADLGVQQASAQLSAAEAQLLLAEQRLKRGKELQQRDFLADDELLALDTQVRAAQAERDIRAAGLANAKRQRDKCTIRAPFDGVVQSRNAQVGALAMPGTPLLRLVATGSPEVEAALPDGLLPSPNNELESETVRYVFQYQSRWLPLQLLRTSQVLEAGSRSRLVRLGFTDLAAPAGSVGTLRIQGQGYALPAGLVIERNSQRGAFVVEGEVMRFRPIEGALPGRSANVDWPATTRVLVEGQLIAEDGQPLPASSAE